MHISELTDEARRLGQMEGVNKFCDMLRSKVPAATLLETYLDFVREYRAMDFPSGAERAEQGLREQIL